MLLQKEVKEQANPFYSMFISVERALFSCRIITMYQEYEPPFFSLSFFEFNVKILIRLRLIMT